MLAQLMHEHRPLNCLAHTYLQQEHLRRFLFQHLLLLALSFQALCLLLFRAQEAVVLMHLVQAQGPPQEVPLEAEPGQELVQALEENTPETFQ